MTSSRLVRLAALAVLALLLACPRPDLAKERRPYRGPGLTFEGASTELSRTVVVPTLTSPFPGKKNVLWCASFPLAWKALAKEVIGEPIRVRNAEAPAKLLNETRIAEADLPEGSFFATADVVSPEFLARIRRTMKRRFPSAPAPELSAPPGSLLAYAYLAESVPFRIPYFENDEPLVFRDSAGGTARVTSFGLREKDLVLAVALEAARLIDALPGYRAVLTRRDDSYPSLERRVGIAAEADGDVFLSIHCNTHRRESVAGMEVYFLSLQGATDREAQELADKENAFALVGLDPARGHDDAVVGILMDLRMSRVLHESSRLADLLLDAADRSDVVAARRVKQARFQVLGQLAMPSALVELAYLSNPGDRELLRDPAQRRRLAALLVEGLVAWRRDRGAASLLAQVREGGWSREYRVQRGDSLWALARRNGTTVDEITRRNDLRTAGIAVGQVLRLPPTGRTP